MSKMLRRLIGDHIDLRIQLSDDAGMVRVDTGKAEQVILNLVVNCARRHAAKAAN